MRVLENIVTDVQELISNDHFPIKARIGLTQGGWTVINFESPNQDFLQIEVHLEQQNACVLETRGFTQFQSHMIMNTFMELMFS